MNQPAVNGGFAPQTLFLGLAASSLQRSFRPGSFSLEKVSSPVWAAECPDSGLQWS